MPRTASASSTATLTVFRLAALFTLLTVAMGSVVCATGSGAGCSTWPGCYHDQLAPHWQLSPLIEFTHRLVAIVTGPLVLAAAVMSRRLPGPDRGARVLPWLALAGALAAGAFGRLAVLSGLPTWLGAVDLFSALAAMTAMTTAAVRISPPTISPPTISPRTPSAAPERVAQLAATGVAVLVAMHVSGILTAGKGSFTRCMGWPLWRLISSDLHPWLQGVRLGLAGLGAALVLGTVALAVRSERLRAVGVAVGTLFAAEMVLGVMIRVSGLNRGVATAYSVLAVALLWTLGLLTALAWTAQAAAEVTPPEPATALR